MTGPPEAGRSRRRDAIADQRRAEERRAEGRWRWLRRLLFGDWTPVLRDPLDLIRLSFGVASLAVAAIVVAIAASAAAAFLLPHSPSGLRGLLVSAGPIAPLIMLAAWILLTPAMFPGTVLAAAGGLAFGAFEGSLLAFGGAIVGGLTAFALARTAGRGPVQRFVERKPRLARSHALLERRGFAAILAARLMPGVPVTALHYAAGVSPVDTRAFAGAMQSALSCARCRTPSWDRV